MARRSYLQRIAEPLRAHDPVLFAVPGAALDDARPPAASTVSDGTAIPTVSDGVPTPSAPVLRRAPTRTATPAAVTTPGRITQPARPSVANVPGKPAAAAPSVPSIAPPAVQASQQPTEQRSTVAVADIQEAAATRRPIPGEAADFVSARPALDIGSPPLAESPAAPNPSGDTRTTRDALPPRHAIPDDIVLEPIGRQPPQVTISKPRTTPEAATPRIHIGTVEVRTAAPSPPPVPAPAPTAMHAAPRSETTPISRAYAWRFGLIQG